MFIIINGNLVYARVDHNIISNREQPVASVIKEMPERSLIDFKRFINGKL